MDYRYLNLNPLNITESDCVTRAISLGTQEDYKVIKHKLYAISLLYNCEKLCVCCYQHLLDKYYGFERVNNCKGLTIKEFASCYPVGTYIIRVKGHLTCLINNILYDIWDCRNEIVDIVWKVE